MNKKINIKRSLSLVLCVLLFISGLPFSVSAVDEASEPVLISAENFAELGVGEEYIGYYGVSEYKHLLWLDKLVFGSLSGVARNSSPNVVLLNDIIINENLLDENKNLNKKAEYISWYGIGSQSYPYGGIFDGNGHSVSGLYHSTYYLTYVGLFSFTDGATIKNLSVTDTYFRGESYIGAVCGQARDTTLLSVYTDACIDGVASYTGGIVGYSKSCDFINCTNDGLVTAERIVGGIVGKSEYSTFENCVNNGNVPTYGDYTGGICGSGKSSVFSACTNNGTVSGANNCTDYVAGICGYSWKSDFEGCVNAGFVVGYRDVGGISGYVYEGYIIDSFNSARVMTQGINYGAVAGICGKLNCGYVERCGNSGTIIGHDEVGGICGKATGADDTHYIKDCFNTGSITAYSLRAAGGICGRAEIFMTIENCYNTGSVYAGKGVATENYGGGICGELSDEGGRVINSYYFEEPSADSSQDDFFGIGIIHTGRNTADAEGVTAAVSGQQLISGEVAYLLRGNDGDASVWGQSIDNGEAVELLPVINGNPVYRITDSNGNVGYSNNTGAILPPYEEASEEHTHSLENGFCTYTGCTLTEAAVEITEENLSQYGLTADYIGYYAIANGGQLTWFASAVNGGEYSLNGVLVSDITVNTAVLDENGSLIKYGLGHKEWIPIGKKLNAYTGHFNGNNHIVKGLYINESALDGAGLFGYVGNTTIENIIIDDSYINAYLCAGGICGKLVEGKILNCQTDNVFVRGAESVGGICGEVHLNGEITNCKNGGKVIAGCINAGGICGRIWPGVITGCVNTGTVESYTRAAGICGYATNHPEIKNCRNEGNLLSFEDVGGICGHMDDCTTLNNINAGDITGARYVGGICAYIQGYNEGTVIEKCVNTGNITSCFEYAGGIGGYMKKNVKITNCYNTGNIVADLYAGGLNGASESGTYKNNFTIGKVKGRYYAGGIAGDGFGSFENCFYITGCVDSKSSLAQNGKGTTLNSAQKDKAGETVGVTLADYASGKVTYLLNDSRSEGDLVWGQDIDNGNTPQPYPVYGGAAVYYGMVYGQEMYSNTYIESIEPEDSLPVLNEAGYYEILNADHLKWFADLVNGKLTDYEQNVSANAILMTDITLNEAVLNADGTLISNKSSLMIWSPVGTSNAYGYAGVFDGNGHTITGLYVPSATSVAGLFGYIKGGTVKNLNLNHVYVKSNSHVGGICGNLKGGTVDNCAVDGVIIASGDKNIYAGGIFGQADGTVTKCGVTGTVTAKGTVSHVYAGGIGGYIYSTAVLSDLINSAEVSASITCKEDTTTTAYGHCYAGGILGYARIPQISECVNTGKVSSTIDPLTGADYSTTDGLAGGICGEVYDCALADCKNSGAVTVYFYSDEAVNGSTNDSLAGGICGYAYGSANSIKNCANTGDIDLKTVVSSSYAGGVAGELSATTVNNVQNDGNVTLYATDSLVGVGGVAGSMTSSAVTDGVNNGDISIEATATSVYAGGAVGDVYKSSIVNCSNTGDVTAKSTQTNVYAGGVGGYLSSSGVTKGFNTGDIAVSSLKTNAYAGGIAASAYNCTGIENCGNVGNVAVEGGTASCNAGGILGNTGSATNITNSYNIGTVSNVDDDVSAICDATLYTTCLNCYYLADNTFFNGTLVDETATAGAKEAKSLESFSSGEVAYLLQSANSEPVWGQNSNTLGSYPVLTEDEAYIVKNVGGTGIYSVAGAGDVNNDDAVDILDYQEVVNLVATGKHNQSETARYDEIIKYDLNGDGYVDALDATLMNSVINGRSAIPVYSVGDFDLNGYAFEGADITAMREEMNTPESLSTSQKRACDLNGDGKVDTEDIIILNEKYSNAGCDDCAENMQTKYTWSGDYLFCTASLYCGNCGYAEFTETVKAQVNYSEVPTCTQEGKGTLTAVFTDNRFESRSHEKTFKMMGHEYASVTYSWADDYSTCTATTLCKNCGGEKITETVNTVYSVENGECGGSGTVKYTAAFESELLAPAIKVVETDRIDHLYDTATYSWADDYSTCTASALCTACGKQEITETVAAEVTVVKKANCTTEGQLKYTATFTEKALGSVFTTVTTPKATEHNTDRIRYVWSSDYSTCTATARCSGCNAVQVTETVEVSCEVLEESTCDYEGYGEYTAVFTNEIFKTQVTEDILPIGPHYFYDVEYIWSDDYSTCTATGYCEYCGCEVTEEGTVTSDDGITIIATFASPGLETQIAYM